MVANDNEQTALPGGNSKREPPDPIPNSEVKLLSADDSVVFPCESRSLPGFYVKTLDEQLSRVFLFLCNGSSDALDFSSNLPTYQDGQLFLSPKSNLHLSDIQGKFLL